MPRKTDSELNRRVGQRVKRARELAGITQAGLAEKAGLQPVSVSRLESGARAVSLANLSGIARALGVPLGDLVDDARPQPGAELSAAEVELVVAYRALGSEQQELAKKLLTELSPGARTTR